MTSKKTELVWAEDSETTCIGVPRLRALFHERHPTWQISEKRLRRVRVDAMEEFDEAFGGMNEQNLNAADGTVRPIHTEREPGSMAENGIMQIRENGEEIQLLPAMGIFIETGRKFKKDSTGEWVLDN
ncbi:hypothetical protein HWV62_6271 [Athelia sp. TMB]|nr:hypothetical protein HWV62_6271 [Athelia sp. TMB]